MKSSGTSQNLPPYVKIPSELTLTFTGSGTLWNPLLSKAVLIISLTVSEWLAKRVCCLREVNLDISQYKIILPLTWLNSAHQNEHHCRV